MKIAFSKKDTAFWSVGDPKRTPTKFLEIGYLMLPYPPYSPGLEPNDVHHSPNMKSSSENFSLGGVKKM